MDIDDALIFPLHLFFPPNIIVFCPFTTVVFITIY